MLLEQALLRPEGHSCLLTVVREVNHNLTLSDLSDYRPLMTDHPSETVLEEILRVERNDKAHEIAHLIWAAIEAANCKMCYWNKHSPEYQFEDHDCALFSDENDLLAKEVYELIRKTVGKGKPANLVRGEP